MKRYGQYNKLMTRILVIVLPALILNLIHTDLENINQDREASNFQSAINKSLYYLCVAIKNQPNEENIPVHFIRNDVRFYQYPQRFFPSDVILLKLTLFNIILLSFLFLNLFIKGFFNATELAHHIGGHAPPALII